MALKLAGMDVLMHDYFSGRFPGLFQCLKPKWNLQAADGQM
jgi:hypothetical protein